MSEKKKLESFTTPAGIAKYPRLNKPETEVNGQALETPRFKVALVLDESEPGVPEFKAKLEAEHAAAIAAADKKRKADPKRKNKPLSVNETIKAHLDDNGDPIEGKFEIVAKTQAVTKDGTPKVMRMFDAKGKPTKANVGGGSKLKLNISTQPHDTNLGAGLSIYLNAVQILDLKQFSGGGDAKGFGFGEEEGYSADESEAPADESSDESSSSDEVDTGAPGATGKGDF
jgi:hypothetical protein